MHGWCIKSVICVWLIRPERVGGIEISSVESAAEKLLAVPKEAVQGWQVVNQAFFHFTLSGLAMSLHSRLDAANFT